jgi:ABC-2 type transport system permease protein
MSLSMMYADELTGFYKSRVMLVLWVGMPVLTLILHALQPNLEGQMSLTVFSMLVVSSMASTIAAVMLSVGIIHEKTRGVYALFLVRPVKRRSILLGKFFAVFTCVAAASAVTLVVGLVVDWVRGVTPSGALWLELAKSAATGFSSIAITSAAAILIGILAPSVLVGAILVIYGANQLSVVGYLPLLLNLQPAWVYSVAIGAVFSVLLLGISVLAFKKKQF